MPPPGNGPAVGISVDLELGSTLQRLADLQEAIGTLGRMQSSPWNRNDYHIGPAQGSFAIDNPTPYQTGSPLGQPTSAPTQPGQSSGFSGSVSQVHIAHVQSLTIQTAAQVMVYGAGSGAGGQSTQSGIPASGTAAAPQPTAQQQVTGGQVQAQGATTTTGAPTQTMTPVAGINAPIPGAQPASAGTPAASQAGAQPPSSGFNPDETIMPGQWHKYAYPGWEPPDLSKNPPPPGGGEGVGEMVFGQLRGLAGAFGVHQMVSWMGHMEQIRQRFEYGGGDVRESQRSFEATTSIPLIGPLVSLFTGESYKKGQQVEGYKATQEFMGLSGPIQLMNQTPQLMEQSPLFLSMAQQMAMQGLRMPGSLADRFAQKETLPATPGTPGASSAPDPTTGVPTWTVSNPQYLDPSVREAVLSSYQRVRTSGAVMGTHGFNPINESQVSEPEQLFRVAMAQGDYSAAQALAGLVGPTATDEVREFGGRMLEGQFRSEVGQLTYGREQAKSTRFRQRGNFLSAASYQYDSASYQGEVQRGIETQIAQLDDLENQALGRLDQQGNVIPGTENAALYSAVVQRRAALEAQREQSEGAVFGARLGAAETRFSGYSAMYGGGIAALSAGAQSGFMTGVGSDRRQMISLQEVRFAEQQADAARRYLEEVGATGATGDVLAGAGRARIEAELGLQQQRVQAAQTPVDLSLQMRLSGAQYQAQVLQSVPGAYGNIRGAYREQLGVLEQEAAQIQQQQQQQRDAGQLNPAAQFEYQQRLQQIGVQQAQAFEQLSYGWENRVMSRAINSPGSFNLEGRGFSMMNTVTAGAWNPHFGARQDQLPFFLRMANLARIPVSGLPGVQGLGPGIPGLPEPAGLTGSGDDGFGAYGPAGGYVNAPYGGSTTGGAGPSWPSGGATALPPPASGPSYDPLTPPEVVRDPSTGLPALDAAGFPLTPESAAAGLGTPAAPALPRAPFRFTGGEPTGGQGYGHRGAPHAMPPVSRTGIPAPVAGRHYYRDFDAERSYWGSTTASPTTIDLRVAPDAEHPHGGMIRSANLPGTANLPGMEIIGHDSRDPRYRQPARVPSISPSVDSGSGIQSHSPKFGGGQITEHREEGVHTIRIEFVVRDGNNQLLGSGRKDVNAGSVGAAINSGGLDDLLNHMGIGQATTR